jgi:hypothetical protein
VCVRERKLAVEKREYRLDACAAGHHLSEEWAFSHALYDADPNHFIDCPREPVAERFDLHGITVQRTERANAREIMHSA